MNGVSAFGVDHAGEISTTTVSKLEKPKKPSDKKKQAAIAGGATAAAAGTLAYGKMPEHSHFDRKTRKYIKNLPPGVHEVDTKMLAKKPRKLGARKQQRSYVASMAQERPTPYSPVPITRYKGGGVIQRDNAHSVMANAMKGRKTTIKVEDAPGYKPTRRIGEELVRRGQSMYQQRRLKRHTNLSEEAIETLRGKYKESSRKANTTKRPHGVVEEGFKFKKHPYGPLRAAALLRKRDDERRYTAAGATGAAGVGVLAATPVRRSAAKVDVSGGQMSARSARRVVAPGYRPGNKKAIKTMATNLGHLENKPTTVIRYKDGGVIPFDGNHRATARIARGDKKIPVKVVEGGERPATSLARNAYHVGQQRLHRSRIDRGAFKPDKQGKHAGERKVYSRIANASGTRSGKRVAVESLKTASGPSKGMLRTKQGLAVGAGAALLGTSGHLQRKKKDPFGVSHD